MFEALEGIRRIAGLEARFNLLSAILGAENGGVYLEIINTMRMHQTVLGSGLAPGAVAALPLTLL